MQDNNNDKDFTPSDFVNSEPEETAEAPSVTEDEVKGAVISDNDGSSSMRTEFLRDGTEYRYEESTASAYQSFGDFRRWDSFSLNDEKKAKAKFSRFFLAVFIYLLSANLIMIGVQFTIMLTQTAEVSETLLGSPNVLLVLNAIILYFISLPILYLIIRKMSFVPRLKSKLSVKELLVYILMAEALMYAGSLVGNLFAGYFEAIFGYDYSGSVDWILGAQPWLLILIACIIGPIVEELIFRKFLMDRLGAYGDRTVIFVSAISFALFHGNLSQLFYAFALGMILAFVYSKTGNVIYTIIMHGTMNFLGSVLAILAMSHLDKLYEILPAMEEALMANNLESILQMLGDNFWSIVIAFAYSSLVTGLVVAGTVLLIIRLRRKKFFVSDRCEVCIPKQRRGAVIFLNVGVMLFLTFNVLSIIFDLITPALAALSGEAI